MADGSARPSAGRARHAPTERIGHTASHRVVDAAPLAASVRSAFEPSHLTKFQRAIEPRTDATFADYRDLHRWSVEHPPEFWAALWDYAASWVERGERLAVDLDRMPGARFFPDGRLNFAANLLRRDDDVPAIIATTEARARCELTFGELGREVRRAAAALRRDGVRPGDRVAGVVANTAEAVIAALGAASIGAIWSACSPDFGPDGIVDRFGQIAPKVLVAVDGYFYGGKHFDCLRTLAEVRPRLPGLARTVIIPYATGAPTSSMPAGAVAWSDWLQSGDDRPVEIRDRSVQSSRSTSSTPRARPECPRPSFTAPAARCCST